MNLAANEKTPFSIAVQNEALWREIEAEADDGAIISDILQLFNGDVYFAVGSMGALDLRVVQGIIQFSLPMRELRKHVGKGIEYDHFPDMFKADESGVDALCRIADDGELYDPTTGERKNLSLE